MLLFQILQLKVIEKKKRNLGFDKNESKCRNIK